MGKREENAKRKLRLKVLFEKIDNGKNRYKTHFLHRREKVIRFKLFHYGYTQKVLAKRLGLTESYITRLINGERYNKEFEIWIRDNLGMNYCFI